MDADRDAAASTPKSDASFFGAAPPGRSAASVRLWSSGSEWFELGRLSDSVSSEELGEREPAHGSKKEKRNEDPVALQTTREREQLLLAPYAMFSKDSRGRRRAEAEHPYRGPYQRDRDRIVHCSAFRRLSGKMQVFTGDRGDYHRTRLTHSQEVASIARTIGRTLRLNEDLVEALALFHDIGHPPFGHAGEDALHECLKDHAGFSHNAYALTIAEQLESRYDPTPGLNLTLEVLESQHCRANKEDETLQPLLEAQVVDAADSITYDAHDTDDAVKLGLVTIDELSELPLVREVLDDVMAREPNLSGAWLRKALVYGLIDRQVTDLLHHSGPKLMGAGFQSSVEARQAEDCRIEVSESLGAEKRALEGFLYERVYRHPDLIQMRVAAQKRLSELFEFYVERPSELPARFQTHCDEVGVHRAVGHYLAGMTDRFCDESHKRLFG